MLSPFPDFDYSTKSLVITMIAAALVGFAGVNSLWLTAFGVICFGLGIAVMCAHIEFTNRKEN